jgi:hypothetical protein
MVCAADGCSRRTRNRGLCVMHMRAEDRLHDANWKRCDVDDCDQPARSPTADLCPRHYHRRYRHGDTATVATLPVGAAVRRDRGYVLVKQPGHSLASQDGWVYQHRLVLWQTLDGQAEAPCSWCQHPVRWDDQTLCVDHLNGDRADNRAENIVASCRSCNAGRRTTDPRRARQWAQTVATRRLILKHVDEYATMVSAALTGHEVGMSG